MDFFFDLLLDGHYVVILNKPDYFLKLSQCPGPCRRIIGFVRFKAVFGRGREGLNDIRHPLVRIRFLAFSLGRSDPGLQSAPARCLHCLMRHLLLAFGPRLWFHTDTLTHRGQLLTHESDAVELVARRHRKLFVGASALTISPTVIDAMTARSIKNTLFSQSQ